MPWHVYTGMFTSYQCTGNAILILARVSSRIFVKGGRGGKCSDYRIEGGGEGEEG